MKFIILFAIVTYASALALVEPSISLENQWNEYKLSFNKVYETKLVERIRRKIWEQNLKNIQKHNIEAEEGKHTYKQSMNQFGDLTNEEFRMRSNGFNMSIKSYGNKKSIYEPNGFQVPDSVDWRAEGYVTPVKDQGQCGSCWAFSAVASLEGQHFKASGTLVSLSEQNLVDCSKLFGNAGCNGGLMADAFNYILFNRGIDTEESYPYIAQDQTCEFKRANVGATLTGHVDVKKGSEGDLVNAIANIGPISVAIDASQDSFQFYSSGVYYEPNCSNKVLDHGVTAVGYGSQNGQDFYIVKNSWAETWGDKGYIMMSRNRNNNCGIASQASFPKV